MLQNWLRNILKAWNMRVNSLEKSQSTSPFTIDANELKHTVTYTYSDIFIHSDEHIQLHGSEECWNVKSTIFQVQNI